MFKINNFDIFEISQIFVEPFKSSKTLKKETNLIAHDTNSTKVNVFVAGRVGSP